LGAAVAVAVLGMLLAMAIAVLGASTRARVGLRRLAADAWRLHPSLHRLLVALHNLAVRLEPCRHDVRRRLGLPRMAMRAHSHRSLAATSALAATPALVVAAVLGGGGGGASLAAGSAARSPLSTYLRTELALDRDVQRAAALAPATWLRLVTIERGLAAQQDELAAQEAQIDRLVINLAGYNPATNDDVEVGADSPIQASNRLATLVAAHTATEAAYQRSLQAEYDLYRAAAQDPAQRTALTQLVATQAPQAKDAVAYNLSLIQTQLSQEQAIAQAEARLRSLGSLSAEQLAAMRKHQAFIAPLVAPVTQPFGPTDFALEPPLSYNGTFYPHFHTGLDLGAPLDTPVHAAADGVVLLAAASVDGAGHLVGYGNYVVIAHPDGFVTLYGHLDSVAVKAGQVVHQGEIVGLEGSTGWSTGPHVHFEIRHGGEFLDPAPYLAGQLPS
jgi:murein DD-endopeptidase MepM/ murein hydrolase activator NlpD